MFTTATKIWSRNILKKHILKPCSVQHINQIRYMKSEKGGTEKSSKVLYTSLIRPEAVGSKEEQQEFKSILPEVINSFVVAYTDVPIVRKRLLKLLQENLAVNEQNSGLLAVCSFKTFADAENLTPVNIKLANILGWCTNLQSTAFNLADDVMDLSETRYGKKCWYRNEDVGMEVINDVMLIENGVYLILQKHLSSLKCYVPIITWCRDVFMKLLIGQAMQASSVRNGKPQLNLFTKSFYHQLMKHKSAYPLYMSPVFLGILLAEKLNKGIAEQAETILTELALFYGVENDILDCYGDPALLGKTVAEDISFGACTWLVMEALQRATPEQRKILVQHYGQRHWDSVLKIQALYADMRLFEEFLIYRDESFKNACLAVQKMPSKKHQDFFYKIVKETYKKSSRNI